MNTYLTFRLGEEYYAAKVAYVSNIMEYPEKITRLPIMQKSVLGIINLRGEALPVIDLPDKLGVPKTTTKGTNFILVMEVNIDKEKISLGVLVNDVEEVIEIEDSAIKAPPKVSMTEKNNFISGVYQKGEIFIMISNMDKVFTYEEISEFKSQGEAV